MPLPILDLVPEPSGSTADDVVAGLYGFAAETRADEIITATYSHDPRVRIDSIHKLGIAWST